MKTTFTLLTIAISLLITSIHLPNLHSTDQAPATRVPDAHTFSDGDVTFAIIDPLNIEVTVSGTTSRVGGELVDNNGNVVDFVNSTNSNPFILTAPEVGNYLINAGYDSPQKRWDSAAVYSCCACRAFKLHRICK